VKNNHKKISFAQQNKKNTKYAKKYIDVLKKIYINVFVE